MKSWQIYEETARTLLDKFAKHFGISNVQGKQVINGLASNTQWEIDGKADKDENGNFVIIECRKYETSRLSQEDMAAIAFRVYDTGAVGAITVSPFDIQSGAKKVAKRANINHVMLDGSSNDLDFLMQYIEITFKGISEQANITVNDDNGISITEIDGQGSSKKLL